MEFKPGMRIGKLVLLEFMGRNKHSKKVWLCQCDCGNICERVEGNLKNTKVPHCGCSPNWKGTNKRFVDLSGQRFGRLTVIEHHGKDKYSHNLWLCKCDCGNVKITETNSLLKGGCSSCGCLKREETIMMNTTHNHSNTRLYNIYARMKARCYKESNKDYKHYGGRGIAICKEWLDSFENFYDWSMANGYSDNLTIDRKDVNGNYEPSNCRWVSMKVQGNNKRTNIFYTYENETHTLSEWSEITNVKYITLYHSYRNGTLKNLISKSLKKPE